MAKRRESGRCAVQVRRSVAKAPWQTPTADIVADTSPRGPREAAAADRWLRDYNLAVHNYSDPARGMGGGILCREDLRVAAGINYDAASAAIGERCDRLLRAHLHEGRSLNAISGGGSTPNARLAGMVKAILLCLSEHYATRDNARAPNPARFSRRTDRTHEA